MKAIYEYILMVVFTLLLNTVVHVFAIFILTEKDGSERDKMHMK